MYIKKFYDIEKVGKQEKENEKHKYRSKVRKCSVQFSSVQRPENLKTFDVFLNTQVTNFTQLVLSFHSGPETGF